MNAEQRHEWLESRRNGIGSSDTAAILGLSKWKNALDVYLAKVTPNKSEDMTGPQEWGHRAEPMIAAAIMDRTGWKLEKVPTVRHPEHEFLIASPDRVNDAGELIEIKTSARSEGWGEPETADVPEAYWIQVQHQLEVCGRDAAWIYVLIGGNDFRRYRLERDPEYLPTVIGPLAEFWECVENRTPPEIDFGGANIVASLNRLYQPKPGTYVALEDWHQTDADYYAAVGEEIAAKTKARDEYKARLIAAVGEHECGILPDGRRVTRKTVERKGYTVEPATFTDFRILKAKGFK